MLSLCRVDGAPRRADEQDRKLSLGPPSGPGVADAVGCDGNYPFGFGGLRVHHLLIDTLILGGVAVLLYAAAHDFGFRTVPDCASIALLLIGIAWRLLDSPRLLPWSAGIAAGILVLTYLLWRQGWMGGGDVKLLTAAGMFVPPWLVPLLVSGTALAGGCLALIYLVAGLIVKRPSGERPVGFVARVLRCEQWRLSRRGPLPYAAAIAVGGVIATLHS